MRHFTCGPVLTLAFCCLGAAVPTTGLADERPCHIDGIETPVTCVTIDVPRDYAAPDGSTITVTAVVVPASTGRPAPEPLVVLAGGPGQSATSVAGALQPLLAHVRRQRDVVLLDVRGTGLSEPLDCELELAAFAAEGEPPPPATIELVRGTAADCARALGARVHHHTDRELVEDIERFRVARGYPQLNLWGGSSARASRSTTFALTATGCAPWSSTP